MSAIPAITGAIRLEPRPRPTVLVSVLVPVLSLLAALIVGAALLAATGSDAVEVYRTVVEQSVGSTRDFSRTLNASVPIILTGLAAAVAYRVRLWTIGADGQLLVGAIAASGVVLWLGDGTPDALLIVAGVVAGVVGGLAWVVLAAVPRAFLGTDEVLTTLMLNFVAISLVSYLILGSDSFWKDPASATTPQGKPLPEGGSLPELFDRAHAGILVAAGVAVLLWLAVTRLRMGYEADVAGDAPEAARYGGISVSRSILVVLGVSGAIAGLAGALVVGNETLALDPARLNQGYGYTGIVVAALARLNLLAVVPVGFLLAGLLNSAGALSILGVPGSITVVLQGLILLFVAGGQVHVMYRMRVRRRAAR